MTILNRSALDYLQSLRGDLRFSAYAESAVAKVYLYDAIGDGAWGGGITSAMFASALMSLKQQKVLEVHINSSGGALEEGIAIYNMIRDFRGESVVKVDGLAGSIASVIAMAGDRIVTASNALWMIHAPRGFYGGTADEFRIAADAMDKARDNIRDIYARRTGQAPVAIEGWLKTETWMSAQEAKDRGFTDEIDNDDDDEAPKSRTRNSIDQFSMRCYALINEFQHAPTAIKRRGPDPDDLKARLAAAIQHGNSLRGAPPSDPKGK